MVWLHSKKLIIVVMGAFLIGIGINLFLIPANVYAGGFTGAAQLISRLVGDLTLMSIPTGVLLFALNVPVTILAWKKVGKSFTVYSFISVFALSLFLLLIPIKPISEDILLNTVFGGAISAVGIGFTLKWGASTGGLDIVAMVLSRMKDRPIGTYIFALNLIIILSAGYLYGWEKALYTLVNLYVTTRVINAIHTRTQKLTVLVVTKNAVEVKHAVHSTLLRGITSLHAKGAYTNQDKELLMIVITRYELFDFKRIMKETDPQAFTTILPTEAVVGFFRKE